MKILKNIKFGFSTLGWAIRQRRDVLKLLVYLFFLALVAMTATRVVPDSMFLKDFSGFCVAIIGPIVPFVGFLIGLTWFKSIKEHPYKPMTNSEHADLLQQLESVGISPTHSNGSLNYDWDAIFDRLYNSSTHNELYSKIVKHYWYLKWHHVVLKEQTHLPNVEKCGKIKAGIQD